MGDRIIDLAKKTHRYFANASFTQLRNGGIRGVRVL